MLHLQQERRSSVASCARPEHWAPRPRSAVPRCLSKTACATDLVAVNQCSGNSRGHFAPRANGGQLSNGAMGNARWTGVPLKKVLEKAGVKAGSVQVSFNGFDKPPVGDGPDFVKALNIDHALNGEVMLAWQMNGADLPLLNGYPVRLIVQVWLCSRNDAIGNVAVVAAAGLVAWTGSAWPDLAVAVLMATLGITAARTIITQAWRELNQTSV